MQHQSPTPNESRGHIEREGAVIHYRRCGSGDPCLLIQGVGVRGDAWQPQMTSLRTKFELCSVDNRGIGDSTGVPSSIDQMAQDALAVLDALAWDRAHVVGHSMGGAIAMSLAANHPARVSSLALLCTVARGIDIFSLSPRVLSTQIRTRIGTRQRRRRAFFEFVSSPDRSSKDESSILELEHAFGRRLDELPAVFPRQMMAFSRFNSKPLWPALSSIKTLVLSAKNDMVCPPRSGKALAQGIEGSHFELVEGAHAVPVQEASTVNGLLEAFWSQ